MLINLPQDLKYIGAEVGMNDVEAVAMHHDRLAVHIIRTLDVDQGATQARIQEDILSYHDLSLRSYFP